MNFLRSHDSLKIVSPCESACNKLVDKPALSLSTGRKSAANSYLLSTLYRFLAPLEITDFGSHTHFTCLSLCQFPPLVIPRPTISNKSAVTLFIGLEAQRRIPTNLHSAGISRSPRNDNFMLIFFTIKPYLSGNITPTLSSRARAR